MTIVRNSTTLQVGWRKSSSSGGNGDCVECASLVGEVAVRDSKNPNGPAHVHSAGAFESFVAAVAADQLVPVV
ncbi:DUF397 domain-containing protein [Kitasatospora sp. NPDC059795]|uniref:DUF397 domain-containing protein n=1 Tax=Kitasatospora sp. NPDC059795 TaxID=3346949 RepID=UPI00365FDD55